MNQQEPPRAVVPSAEEETIATTSSVGAAEPSSLSSSQREGTTPGATPELPKASVPPGAVLPPHRYTVEKRLGSGGGGQVYAVVDGHLEREVALKVMRGAGLSAEEEVALFIAEARLTARLEHPNILPIYDVGCGDDGRWFFSMRRARGRALADLISEAKRGEIPSVMASPADRAEIIIRAADAIAYAHSRGVIHRDLKPSNIMIGDYGEVLVLDWGAALDQRAPRAGGGETVGTPTYMAPEQARGELADERSDVYGLGATLWHLVTLERPAVTAPSSPDFWERKFKGELPAAPADAPQGLIAVARRALASDPADRFQSAVALRDALRTWQRNQSSIALTDHAERALEQAQKSGEYGAFLRACDGYRNALEAWSDNARARAGLSRALAQYARFAVRRGDLQLAAELLDPDDRAHDAVRAEIDAARELQAAARRHGARWRMAASLAFAAVLGLAAWFVWDSQRAIGAWHRAWSFEAATGSLASLEPAYPDHPERPERHSGGITLPKGELYWIRDLTARGNVRFEADVEWRKGVDGFEILLESRREQPPVPWDVTAGYSCQFGGYSGAVSFVSQNRAAGHPTTSEGVGIDLVPGRRYRLAFILDGDAAALEVDGVERLRLQGLLPLGDSSFQHVGIRSWSDVVIYRMAVHRQAVAEKPGPLVAGDALVAAGHYADAARAYRDVARDFPGSSAAEDALARAYLAAGLAKEPPGQREQLLVELTRAFPNSRHRQHCEEASAIDQWRAGSLLEGLSRAERVLDRFPESRIALSMADLRPRHLERGLALRLFKLLSRTQHVARLDISWMQVGDLSALHAMPLVELRAYGTGITDLSPLRGMRLRTLDVSQNHVRDLSPLRGMPLTELRMVSTDVEDLAPIAGAPIRRIDVSNTPVQSLEPLRGAPLEAIACTMSRVRSLAPLAGAPLERVEIGGLGISDLSWLSGAPLRYLDAEANDISDLSPLAAGRTWENIVLAHNEIRDVSALAGSTGLLLELQHNPISDISALATAHWEEIGLSHDPITDLAPLARLGAKVLRLDGLPQVRLAPLASAAVEKLSLWRTPIADPDSLLEFRQLSDLTVIEAMPVARLDALAGGLEQRNRPRELVASVRRQAFYASGDVDALRRAAVVVGDSRLLTLPLTTTYASARAIAASLGGSLPRITNDALRAELNQRLPDGRGAWLDLESFGGALRWGDGTAVDLCCASQEAQYHPFDGGGWYAFRRGQDLPEWLQTPTDGPPWGESLTIVMWPN